MKSRLYIWILSAILVAAWSNSAAAESEKNGQTPKKKVQVILVEKKDRERSSERSKTDETRPRNHSRR